MQRIKKDIFFDFIRKYNSDSDYHFVGEVNYYLLHDDKAYNGIRSHREALNSVFNDMVKKSPVNLEKGEEILNGRDIDTNDLRTYDVNKAQPTEVTPQLFFYCPNIVSTGYYFNVSYDAEWKKDNYNFGTTVPYWYALMEPVYGKRNKPEDFKKVNKMLFPNGTNELYIYEWTTDWSDYFDDGHEWYGACCWSIYDKTMNRFVVMLVSATD